MWICTTETPLVVKGTLIMKRGHERALSNISLVIKYIKYKQTLDDYQIKFI